MEEIYPYLMKHKDVSSFAEKRLMKDVGLDLERLETTRSNVSNFGTSNVSNFGTSNVVQFWNKVNRHGFRQIVFFCRRPASKFDHSKGI